DLDAGSFDNCTAAGDLVFSFSADPSDQGITLSCDDLQGEVQMQIPVEIWVTDEAGNQDFCETFILLQDNMGACGDPQVVNLGGAISTEENEGVEGVEVELNGSNQFMLTTDATGMYNFSNVPLGGDYTVTPQKDVDPLNGVTTFDLVLITKHILGSQYLDSPYKIIAADANNSGSVTTFDLVVLRRLILHIDDDFANNTSWRFVDKDFVFPNPQNPFETVFPEIININNLPADVDNADFVAIKVGDVNGSAAPNLQTVEDRNFHGTLTFALDELRLEKGQTYTVDFRARDFQVQGYQFTLNFDADVLEFVEILPGVAEEENFGLTLLDEGAITTSWNGESARIADDEVLFSLVFRAKSNGVLSNLLSVNSRYTAAEAYDLNGNLLNVNLVFEGTAQTPVFELYQNTPNPFAAETVIGFNLPEATHATLTITDISGRVLKVVEGDFAKGYNQVRILRKDLSGAGVLYYQLQTPTHTASRKMILVD
ncbi:MAG: T9SS C-terminal target domain-containing protein, partial [Bacteroidetes bacterium]